MSAKLVITFAGSNGSNVKFSYGYADQEVEASNVSTLVQTIITNGSIFNNPPVSVKTAKMVVTTETPFSLNGE